MSRAWSIRVQGVVQGVGFRPFLYRLAQAGSLRGWVTNDQDGVELHLEGPDADLKRFVETMREQAPPGARIASVTVSPIHASEFTDFAIRPSRRSGSPTAEISPDLPVCEDCLRELFEEQDRRYRYPYINCANCGPRFSVIHQLPYDRPNTTMRTWPMDEECGSEYADPSDRRFHAQPIACPACGPQYECWHGGRQIRHDPITAAAALLREGKIVAVKGIGGFHLACDATNQRSVTELRERKFRKDRPFALMPRDIDTARRIADLSAEAEALLMSPARPIVLAPAKVRLGGVAPGTRELGLLLPYAPVHHLLFASGAPGLLVMTSANRSNEPIAFTNEDAAERLRGIADAFLVGDRPIARRVDDSIARVGVFGPVILRRSRGYSPGAVTAFPGVRNPILAVGADLKNTVALVVDGRVLVSQHIGDLDQHQCRQAFQEAIHDLTTMYRIDPDRLTVAHDLHPEYASTSAALEMQCAARIAVQHHRAHIASVLAERQAWNRRIVGVSFDGTGYGDDGSVWGGEFFAGSLGEGLQRVLHLRQALLPGGDAAARFPVQAAAGYLSQLQTVPDLCAPPFGFPERYRMALRVLRGGARCFASSSVGRLFDAAAALLGFTCEVTYEGQAAMWLEQLARRGPADSVYRLPVDGGALDFRPLLEDLLQDRLRGVPAADIARSFHSGVAAGVVDALQRLTEEHATSTCVLSGGVFQNELLLAEIQDRIAGSAVEMWVNSAVPPNDGGISLGQAAMAAFHAGAPDA